MSISLTACFFLILAYKQYNGKATLSKLSKDAETASEIGRLPSSSKFRLNLVHTDDTHTHTPTRAVTREKKMFTFPLPAVHENTVSLFMIALLKSCLGGLLFH